MDRGLVGRGLARSAHSAAIVAVTLGSVFAVGCTPSHTAGSPAARSVRVALCGGAPLARPNVVNLACLDNAVMARHLRWSDWGRPIATATGSATVDLCAYEDCYAGDYVTVPIVLITSKIVRCAAGAQAYSRMQYVFVGRSPYAGLEASISIPDGSTSPANPADQSISLTC